MKFKLKRKIRFPLWLKVLFISFILYVIGIFILIITQNVILFPTVVLIGNFMVPIAYVAFFYERRFIAKITALTVITGFLYGGLLGVFIASAFEPIFIQRLNLITAFEVGLIEEFAKILGVVWIMKNKKHTSQMSGIIIGAAVGMGFAALESTGYTFASFLESQGNLTDTVLVTLFRGILSPVGHGIWTAILAGELFKDSKSKKFVITRTVFAVYLFVSALHGLRDGLPSFFVRYVLPGVDFFIAEGLVAFIGIIYLIKVWREAKKREASLFMNA